MANPRSALLAPRRRGTLRGWVWNVAFGRRVRVQKREGSDIVLDTDDPEGSLAAIRDALAATT